MKKVIVILSVVALILLLVLAGLLMVSAGLLGQSAPTTVTTTAAPTTTVPTTVATEPPPTETEPPPTEPPFEPQMTADSDPANWGMTWEVMAGGETVESYQREEPISFDDDAYFALPGVPTFRGNNYRNAPSYGTADISSGTMNQLWKTYVGHQADPEWGGCGWTGQPLVVQWDAETKAIMNLYEDKKQKEDLVEAIYAKMDGYVHFIDMEDGTATRDPLYVGMVFKGSGALDPRGYPLLYLGSGISKGGKAQTMFVVNLIDCTVIHEISGSDKFALRRWFAFDSSPLVDAETDTLIWPCESGVLYTIKLNTQYDKTAGTISVTPDEPVKARYTHNYFNQNRRYLGMEASAVAVKGYLYIADNAGMLMCVNLNTMQLVWAQDIIDDVNATPLFDWGEDGNGYIYIAPSLDYSNGGTKNDLPIYKIDARTGQIVWSHSMTCVSYNDISGGALASPLMGRAGTDMADLIIFTMGRSPSAWDGQMVALSKATGEVVWQTDVGNYAWSSPNALYTESGKGYIVQSDASGHLGLYEGATGQLVSSVELGATVEASPVVFNDRVLIGTRSGMYLFDID